MVDEERPSGKLVKHHLAEDCDYLETDSVRVAGEFIMPSVFKWYCLYNSKQVSLSGNIESREESGEPRKALEDSGDRPFQLSPTLPGYVRIL